MCSTQRASRTSVPKRASSSAYVTRAMRRRHAGHNGQTGASVPKNATVVSVHGNESASALANRATVQVIDLSVLNTGY